MVKIELNTLGSRRGVHNMKMKPGENISDNLLTPIHLHPTHTVRTHGSYSLRYHGDQAVVVSMDRLENNK